MAESSTLLCYFATIPEAWPWMRQTEDGNGALGRVQFVLASQASHSFPSFPSPAETSSAWLVVFDEAPAGFSTTVPRERRILFVTEPPEIKKYPRSYLGQFGTVVSPYDLRGVERRSMVISNPCLSWHYGVERSSGKNISKFSNLNELRTFPMPEKPGLVSVVCSSKTATSAQRARLALVRMLKEWLGDALHVYGREFNPVDDKMSAIAPYKYHVVLENNYLDNFWTEKLSDAWLGWALPLYLGAPNLGAVCPSPGFVPLPLGDLEACAQSILSAIKSRLWEARQAELALCRNWMMETTNVFARAARMMETAPEYCQRQPALGRPEPIFGSGRDDVAAIYRQVRGGGK
ncbi:glycosyltransferase family 10 domain-containing protein [Desulfovibrio sp. QI0442]